ncbi:MAG: hypothetical protein ACJATP_003013, partial [Candidatus Azotimanducaceae bacterium]
AGVFKKRYQSKLTSRDAGTVANVAEVT